MQYSSATQLHDPAGGPFRQGVGLNYTRFGHVAPAVAGTFRHIAPKDRCNSRPYCGRWAILSVVWWAVQFIDKRLLNEVDDDEGANTEECRDAEESVDKAQYESGFEEASFDVVKQDLEKGEETENTDEDQRPVSWLGDALDDAPACDLFDDGEREKDPESEVDILAGDRKSEFHKTAGEAVQFFGKDLF